MRKFVAMVLAALLALSLAAGLLTASAEVPGETLLQAMRVLDSPVYVEEDGSADSSIRLLTPDAGVLAGTTTVVVSFPTTPHPHGTNVPNWSSNFAWAPWPGFGVWGFMVNFIDPDGDDDSVNFEFDETYISSGVVVDAAGGYLTIDVSALDLTLTPSVQIGTWNVEHGEWTGENAAAFGGVYVYFYGTPVEEVEEYEEYEEYEEEYEEENGYEDEAFAWNLPAPAGADTANVLVFGDVVDFLDGVGPVYFDNTLLVPVRSVFTALGYDVFWFEDQMDQWVTLHGPAGTATFIIGLAGASVNSDWTYLPGAARLYQERTVAPIVDILLALGYNVDWDAPTRTLIIYAAAEHPIGEINGEELENGYEEDEEYEEENGYENGNGVLAVLTFEDGTVNEYPNSFNFAVGTEVMDATNSIIIEFEPGAFYWGFQLAIFNPDLTVAMPDGLESWARESTESGGPYVTIEDGRITFDVSGMYGRDSLRFSQWRGHAGWAGLTSITFSAE